MVTDGLPEIESGRGGHDTRAVGSEGCEAAQGGGSLTHGVSVSVCCALE